MEKQATGPDNHSKIRNIVSSLRFGFTDLVRI